MASAGAYRYPIVIYHRFEEQNEYGEVIEEYKAVRKTRAAINFRGGTRNLSENEIRFPNQYELIVRNYCEITDSTQIEYEGKMYRVVEYHEDLEYRDKIVVIELVND